MQKDHFRGLFFSEYMSLSEDMTEKYRSFNYKVLAFLSHEIDENTGYLSVHINGIFRGKLC